MKGFRFLASVVVACVLLPIVMIPTSQAKTAGEDPLATYKNKYRVLLVFAPSGKDATYQKQRKLWQSEKAEFADRDLVIVPVLQEDRSATTSALSKRYATDARSFKVVLIGKDCHAAFSSDKPVTAEALYTRIDAMPMRREEMRRKGK